MSDTNTGVPAPEGEAGLIDTDYEIGQDNIETQIGPFGLDIHNPVFAVSAGVIVLFVVAALIFPTQAADFFGWLRPALPARGIDLAIALIVAPLTPSDRFLPMNSDAVIKPSPALQIIMQQNVIRSRGMIMPMYILFVQCLKR